MKESKRELIKRLRTAIVEVKELQPDLDRMQAWKLVVDGGCDVPWESFKRFWHESR
jgi:hypothetical protein